MHPIPSNIHNLQQYDNVTNDLYSKEEDQYIINNEKINSFKQYKTVFNIIFEYISHNIMIKNIFHCPHAIKERLNKM